MCTEPRPPVQIAIALMEGFASLARYVTSRDLVLVGQLALADRSKSVEGAKK